jgi:hypothetical protein
LGANVVKWVRVVSFAVVLNLAALPGFSQAYANMQQFLAKGAGLSQQQIDGLRNGQPVAKALSSRTPAEIVILGVVYINADPASYVSYAEDIGRLAQTLGYLAIRRISHPPQLSDFQGFDLDSEDFQALKNCTPGNCAVQLPGSIIEDIRKSIDWSAPDANQQLNLFAQKLALARLQLYQKQGNPAFDAQYNDKKTPVDIAAKFRYILSYPSALPKNQPEFYNYLLSYPQGKPANVSSYFYWDNVKFGLKPTLRIVQVFTLKGTPPQQPAYAIAEKQLYSSHYFETALDLTFCIQAEGGQPGFYLMQVMGSEQAGLTGLEGSIVRHVAVNHSVSDEVTSLTAIKNALEHK